MTTAIGVDMGASRIKLALVDEAGAVLSHITQPTPRTGSGPQIVDEIVAMIRAFRQDIGAPAADVRGTGIVVPYFVDGPQWIQRLTNNMPAMEGLAMRPLLAERIGGEIAMANDVSAAAMAEHMFGVGRGTDRMVLVSIGTGISIGVIADDELLQYTWGTAGDAGHIVIDTEGRHECTCGGRGCLETVSSGTGIQARGLEAGQRGESKLLAARLAAGQAISAEDVSVAARRGDLRAKRIFERAAFFLGAALASYVQIFRPHVIVLSGGVLASSDLLLDGIRRSLRDLVGPIRSAGLQGVLLSAFPDLGAAIGSASLILVPGRYLRDRQLYGTLDKVVS
jgi:glucokinase